MIGPEDPRHGTTKGFHAGCRELCCRRALARDEKARRLERLRGGRAVPAIGAQRRLQALMRLGWSSHRIAVEAGLPHRNHVWRIINGQNGRPTTWIQKATDKWVRDVYDRLSMTIPTGRYVSRTRMYAERQGWLPPLAWTNIDDPNERPEVKPAVDDTYVDEAAVYRRMHGDKTVRLTKAEAAEVVDRCIAAGWPWNQIELRTGLRADRYRERRAG